MIEPGSGAHSSSAAFVSLGCFKNLVDSEVLGGLLHQSGLRIAAEYEPSDWLIVNTCGFIRDAKEEGIAEIIKALEKKEQGEVRHVAVVGCLPQRYLKELRAGFPAVDLFWGVNDWPELVRAIVAGPAAGQRNYPDRDLFLYSHDQPRIMATTLNTTFIKISEGCNMTCSFCVIPRIRGRYRSRTIDSIRREAEQYRQRGVQELNLVSQNSTFFGRDRQPQSQLPELLQEIARLKFPWVRVLYLMPEEVNDDMIAAFDQPTVLPYFDLPFQHVDPLILKKMNRGGDPEKNLDLINRIRRRFPAAIIRSTFITGFPGEGPARFARLLDFASRSAIERIGVFAFSAEEGSPAFQLPGRVSERVARERKERLLDVSDQNLLRYNRGLVGTTQEFLPLGPWTDHSTIGRIASQAPEVDGLTRVNRPFNDDYRIVPIRIGGYDQEMLHGEKI